MTDRERELIMDAVSEGESICCGAKMYGDICADCKEHSGPAPTE